MNVRIVARHSDLPEDLRARAEGLIAKLTKYDPRLTRAEVVFDEEKRSKKVEAILHLDRVDPIVAHAEGDDYRSVLDRLVNRLQRQLRDGRARATDHQADKFFEATAPE
jgi:ribosomal subunit interface protein